MGYYQGDFYRGARGDPGFFGFLGGLAKSAVGLIPGVGPVASKIIGGIGGAISKPVARASAAGAGMGAMSIVKKGAAAVGGAIVKHPVLSAAGAAGAVGALGTMGAEHLLAPGGAHKGFHISRRTGKVVRNRHMNPCNPKALRRAVHRALRFKKIAMKTIHLVSPRAAKGKRWGGFKKARKRAA